MRKVPKKRPGEEGYDPYDFTSSESEGEEPAPPTSSPDQEEAMETAPTHMSSERSVISLIICWYSYYGAFLTGCLHSVPKWVWLSPRNMLRAYL